MTQTPTNRNATKHELALGVAAEYARLAGRGDVVLAAGSAKDIDDLVGYWDQSGPAPRLMWPADVAAVAGVTPLR